MLDLDFDAEQEMLRETVRGVCATHSPLSVVRQLEDDPVGYPPELWKQLGQLDLIGILLPEEYGGAGMSLIEGVVLYEEFGRSLAPTPHFVSAVLCGGALATAGSVAQRQAWLAPIVTGEAILTPAWFEPENSCAPAGVQVRAVVDGDGLRISGTKRHVAFASAAHRLVVLARTGDAIEDVDLFLVDPAADGVTLSQQHAIGSDAQFRVDLHDVRVTADDRIGPEGSGWRTWDRVMHDGCILLGAQAMGGARHLGARVLAVLGDSVTTDHISPAGSIKANGPAGKYLSEHGIKPADFNSYGSRRGNHEVMVRGTFANVRLRNKLAPGTEGGVTRLLPEGEPMSIFDASVKYAERGVPLVILAGKEYGSGSSRDWAAKGPNLLGVRAVIAESFERIHRSNLVGMGILPLQFEAGQNVESLGLTGEEVFSFAGLTALLSERLANSRDLTVKTVAADGSAKQFTAKVRIDTPQEIEYFEHGGILQYVLRQLAAK